MKKTLLEQGFIQGFTILPDFYKIGYHLLVFTFVRIKPLLASAEERRKGHEIAKEWMNRQPNVVFAHYCRGMGMDGFMISFHKSYEEFNKFIQKHNQEIGHQLNDFNGILLNLSGEETLKHFHFKYLAENPREKKQILNRIVRVIVNKLSFYNLFSFSFSILKI